MDYLVLQKSNPITFEFKIAWNPLLHTFEHGKQSRPAMQVHRTQCSCRHRQLINGSVDRPGAWGSSVLERAQLQGASDHIGWLKVPGVCQSSGKYPTRCPWGSFRQDWRIWRAWCKQDPTSDNDFLTAQQLRPSSTHLPELSLWSSTVWIGRRRTKQQGKERQPAKRLALRAQSRPSTQSQEGWIDAIADRLQGIRVPWHSQPDGRDWMLVRNWAGKHRVLTERITP